MRLLILDQFSELGGAQQCLLDLLPAIRERGWTARVALPGDGPMLKRISEAGFETASIECGPYSNGHKSAADLARFLADMPRLARRIGELAVEMAADAVYVNGPRLLPAVPANGRPVVFHAHRIVPGAAVRSLCGWRLRQLGARVIGVCRFAAEPWKGFAGPENTTVIYNGVAGPEKITPRTPARRPRIGCIGRIAPEKGQLEFVKAASFIHRVLPECRFSIYGAAVIANPGYEREVRAAAKELPIEFAGWTGDVHAALADLDLLLAPSDLYESTTRVILEAFAAGTPVIAFPSGGIPEVIEDGRTGLLARGARAMAECAVCLLRDYECQQAIAAAARVSWEERFTLERWRGAVLDYIARQISAMARRNLH
jgi:glycosyltransferase involved in cell wall biosynthesis